MPQATKTLTAEDLRGFTGSETMFRHALVRSALYTEGVQFMAERGGAYWLVDKIITEGTMLPKLRGEAFQVWKLTLRDIPKHSATLVVEDGNGGALHRELIEFTDFPLPEITLWLVGGTLMLPSEY